MTVREPKDIPFFIFCILYLIVKCTYAFKGSRPAFDNRHFISLSSMNHLIIRHVYPFNHTTYASKNKLIFWI